MYSQKGKNIVRAILKRFILAPLFFNTSLELGEGKISQCPAKTLKDLQV